MAEESRNRLKQALSEQASVRPGIVDVSSFLNHRVNAKLWEDVAVGWRETFGDAKPTVVLTLEASGVVAAFCAAKAFGIETFLFAKKRNVFSSKPAELPTDVEPRAAESEPAPEPPSDCYFAKVRSFTREKEVEIYVKKRFLQPNDCVLVVDDFLASGSAVLGLLDIVKQAGAQCCGVAVAIEKTFQNGRQAILEKHPEVKIYATVSIKALQAPNIITYEQ